MQSIPVNEINQSALMQMKNLLENYWVTWYKGFSGPLDALPQTVMLMIRFSDLLDYLDHPDYWIFKKISQPHFLRPSLYLYPKSIVNFKFFRGVSAKEGAYQKIMFFMVAYSKWYIDLDDKILF